MKVRVAQLITHLRNDSKRESIRIGDWGNAESKLIHKAQLWNSKDQIVSVKFIFGAIAFLAIVGFFAYRKYAMYFKK